MTDNLAGLFSPAMVMGLDAIFVGAFSPLDAGFKVWADLTAAAALAIWAFDVFFGSVGAFRPPGALGFALLRGLIGSYFKV